MHDFLNIFTGTLIGALGSYWVYRFFWKRMSRETTQKQSVVLLEKIRNVCKLVTVEGEFAEIYQYENVRERFMKLFSSRKKALMIINARVHIGFDLRKIGLSADNSRKKIILTSFPAPEVLSIEPQLQYYDIKDGLFNKFNPQDHSELQREAREHILKKVPESGLMQAARKEALDAVLMIESMVQAIGWSFDYTALQLSGPELRKYNRDLSRMEKLIEPSDAAGLSPETEQTP